MFRLIIADDEPIILKTMEKRFDWQAMGFELVSLCNDGDAAIDYLKKNPVDVVLTDIRMCRVSGMEVAKFVYESFQNVKVIFLSGYQDFTYAKQGMQYNVFDYILKPVNPQELQNTFANLRDELEKTGHAAEVFVEYQPDDYKRITTLLRHIGSLVDDSPDKRFWISIVQEKYLAETAPAEVKYSIVCEFHRQILACMQGRGLPLTYKMEQLTNTIADLSTEDLIRRLEAIERELMEICGHERIWVRDTIIQEVKDYVQDHLGEAMTVDGMARWANLSQRQFMRKFSLETGESFGKYLNRVRMEKALELLSQDETVDIDDICELIGFKDPKYFKTVFKAHFNCSVREYLARKKQDSAYETR